MADWNVVFHVDKRDSSLRIACRNAVNYANALVGEEYEMVLVVNSAAVKDLDKANSEFAADLQEAAGRGLQVRACNNALAAAGMVAEQLLPCCAVVPAGIVELVTLQKKGYAYIKP